jgi:hypothetical protein
MHQEEYKGHQIAVDTRKVGKGYMWSYQIDGGDLREQYGDRPQSEDLALSEGISNAKFAVDQMMKGK